MGCIAGIHAVSLLQRARAGKSQHEGRMPVYDSMSFRLSRRRPQRASLPSRCRANDADGQTFVIPMTTSHYGTDGSGQLNANIMELGVAFSSSNWLSSPTGSLGTADPCRHTGKNVPTSRRKTSVQLRKPICATASAETEHFPHFHGTYVTRKQVSSPVGPCVNNGSKIDVNSPHPLTTGLVNTN